MANTPQDDRFYKPSTLWKAFGISSVLMLLFTIWMLMDDFGKSWKGYQYDFFALRQKKYNEWIEQAKSGVDEAALTAAKEKLTAAQKNLQDRSKEIHTLEKQLDDLKTKEKIETAKYQGEKAVWDVEKYEYEAKWGHKIAEGHSEDLGPKARKAYDALMAHWNQVVELRNKMNAVVQLREDKEKEIDGKYDEKRQAEKELATAKGQLVTLEEGKEAAALTLTKLIRSAPLVDMANPVLRLQQIVLPTIRDDIYFAQVQKVDRCTTCHMAIDTPGFENEANPFKTHPKLDLILGSRSPHPIDKIGCTVCHEGRGQATEFSRTAHTPQNEAQKKQWEKKYHWHEQHHVIEKMVPLQYTEGKCRVCHKQTEYVPRAPKLNKAVQLIRAAGCYGCHRIEGWDHVRKPAPSLKRIKGKVTRDWMVKWVRDPRSFNEHSRMPRVFHQSNITNEEYKQYQEAEIHAISDYLLSLSEDYRPNYRTAGGSAEHGKKLFGSIGCLGCHQIDDFERVRGRYGMAPDLSTVGSKVSRDWLASWLKNPRHYWDETTMPSFRLTDSEIADISAYLMGKKNPQFESAQAGSVDVETQKKVLKLYLMRDPKLAPTTDAKVDGVIAELKPHEVGQRLGAAAVMRYGCFGCHEIKGLEKTQGIGTELTEEGSKPVNKLDFGLLHLEHTNHAWFHKKLEDPRVFDKGIVKEYLDLLRMPHFEFNDEERNSLVLAILGMTSQKISPPAAKALSPREAMTEEGFRVIHRYNCQGCHTIEQLFQPLPEDHPGFEEHQKGRFDLEGRILAYYAEDETLGPPPLVTQGPRTKTPWLHSFLHNPGQVKLRDRLEVRMPTFQFPNSEVNAIVTGWATQGNVQMPVEPETAPQLSAREMNDAKTLFTKLQCLNCHTIGRKPTPEEMEGGTKGLAPDLIHANKRLRYDWIVALLKDPQKMIPGTRMPGFWPDGQAPDAELFRGNSERQVQALAAYLISLGGRLGTKEPNEGQPSNVTTGAAAKKARTGE